MKKHKPEIKKVNIFTASQIQAITDGIKQSAFIIEISNNDDGSFADLTSGGKAAFRVDLSRKILYRQKNGLLEVAYQFVKLPWYKFNEDDSLWENLSKSIFDLGELAKIEPLSLNLFRKEEIELIIDAIKGMVFKVSTAPESGETEVISFDDREVFRFRKYDCSIEMVDINGGRETVYTFAPEPTEWFWSNTDRDLLKRLNDAIAFHKKTIQTVKMHNFRSLFGRQLQEIIGKLAFLMEEAEHESQSLARIDATAGGRSLHPAVAQLVQKDLDSAEESLLTSEEE